jgi:hypothetical protein
VSHKLSQAEISGVRSLIRLGQSSLTKEVGRTTIQGRTVVTYNLFASGLPRDQHYVLCILNVGGDPQPVADAYLNGDGKVVNVLADPAHNVAEDPIDAKAFGGKGEPIQFALISDEHHLRAFTQVIPFPWRKLRVRAIFRWSRRDYATSSFKSD